MSEGSRRAQKAAGTFVGLVAAVLLLGHYVTDTHAPSDLEFYMGGGFLVIAAWLWAPVGMGGLIQQLRKAWHEFRGHDDG